LSDFISVFSKIWNQSCVRAWCWIHHLASHAPGWTSWLKSRFRRRLSGYSSSEEYTLLLPKQEQGMNAGK
jgi:hypothetical protein